MDLIRGINLPQRRKKRKIHIQNYQLSYSQITGLSSLPELSSVSGHGDPSESFRPRVVIYSKIDLSLALPGWFWWMESNAHRARTTCIQHHLARLLKYYPRPPCAPTFSKSAKLRIVQTHSYRRLPGRVLSIRVKELPTLNNVYLYLYLS